MHFYFATGLCPIRSSSEGLDDLTMRYWLTPFSLSTKAWSTLIEAGLQPWPEGCSSPPEADSLLLYDSPDQLITVVRTVPESEVLTPMSLLQGYRRLLGWSEQTGQPLLSISQLQRLGPQGLRTWISDAAAPFPAPPPPQPIPPLLALVSLSLLVAEPALLDHYYDLELRAVLLGCDPDLRYRERLLQAGQEGDSLLQAFHESQRGHHAHFELEQRLSSRDTELREAREEAELSMLQLHQVQEELEHSLLAGGEKQRQLEAGVRDLEELRRSKVDLESSYQQELQALRHQLEPRLAEQEQRLATRDTELRETKKEAELSMLQLHQVQEELEHSLLAGGETQRQLEACVRDLEELRRSKADQKSAHEQELQALRQQLEPPLAELEQRLATRDTELRETKKEAELSMLQLHMVQEELEHYLLADGEKQRQLEAGVRDLEELRRSKADQESAHEQELQALRQQLEPRLAELEQRLATRDTELRAVREEAELTQQQLHQVQEELEEYFLKACASDQLAQAQLEQLQRAQRLMVRLHPEVHPTASFPPTLAVEVLPKLSSGAMPESILQTQALLRTYAASLERASALLERARRF